MLDYVLASYGVMVAVFVWFFFFFQAEDGIRDVAVTGVQTCALPISPLPAPARAGDADRAARVHPSGRGRRPLEASREQERPPRGRATLELGADHRPRREHRPLPRSAAAARREDRGRGGTTRPRVSAQD